MSEDAYTRLGGLSTACGGESADLRLGPWTVRLAGLDRALADELALRWGPFLERPGAGAPAAVLAAFESPGPGWLPVRPDEPYRLEAQGPPPRRVIVSQQFALAADPAGAGAWKLGLVRGSEPAGTMIENAVRFLAANLAIDHGGFAMHAAGVLHEGRALLYAGPSRAGKSTAVAASAPAASLGDDFALVFREGQAWMAPALPFDNSERIGPGALRGSFPVAAIWRLYQGDGVRVERPSPRVAAASLLSCAAFPWAYPERAGALLDHVQRFVAGADFAHLHFERRADLYAALLRGCGHAP